MHKTETFELFITSIRCCFVFVVFLRLKEYQYLRFTRQAHRKPFYMGMRR